MGRKRRQQRRRDQSPSSEEEASLCRHTRSVQPQAVKQAMSKNRRHLGCASCEETDDVCICLSCGHIGCGRMALGHALEHAGPSHPMSIRVDQTVWCYQCDAFLEQGNDKRVTACRTVMAQTQRKREIRTRSVSPLVQEIVPSNVPKGLVNLGNTCYFNSVAQCLLETCDLQSLLANEASSIHEPAHLALHDFMNAMSPSPSTSGRPRRSKASFNPSRLLKTITQRHVMFRGGQQQDAHELLLALLSTLHEEWEKAEDMRCRAWSSRLLARWTQEDVDQWTESLGLEETPEQIVLSPNDVAHLVKKWKSKPSKLIRRQLPLGSKRDKQVFATGIEQLYLGTSSFLQQWAEKESCIEEKHSNVVTYLFRGQVRSRVTCGVCHHTSDRLEDVYDLTLPLTQHPQSLEDALQAAMEEEQLDGANAYACDECTSVSTDSSTVYTSASKSLRLLHTPAILVLHLNRLKRCQRGLVKNNVHIAFPIRLNLSTIDSNLDQEYTLYGVVVQHGSMRGGHYTSFVQHSDGAWYHFSDDQVTRVREDRVLQAEAFLLLYSRAPV